MSTFGRLPLVVAAPMRFFPELILRLGVDLGGIYLGGQVNGTGSLAWIDGSDARFTNWLSEAIDAHIASSSVVMHTGIHGPQLGRWNFADSAERYGVLCQKSWRD